MQSPGERPIALQMSVARRSASALNPRRRATRLLLCEESVVHLLEKFGEKPRYFEPEGASRPQVTGNRDLLGLCEQIVGLPDDAGDSFGGIRRQRGVTAEVVSINVRRGSPSPRQSSPQPLLGCTVGTAYLLTNAAAMPACSSVASLLRSTATRWSTWPTRRSRSPARPTGSGRHFASRWMGGRSPRRRRLRRRHRRVGS